MVPLLILSARVAPGQHDAVVGSVDVAATILALAGIDHPTLGRSLLAQDLRRAAVFGMRRTFANHPVYEERINSEPVLLDELDFYAVDSHGQLQRGNGRKIDHAERLSAEEEQQLLALFARFESRLSSVSFGLDRLDEESRQALAALGYVD